MASLIDLLIDDLNNEDTGYNKLLDLSNDKTSAIVKGDVDELQKIFLQEQKLIEELETVEQKRQEDVKEICSILRLPYEQIRVEHIVQILEKKPKEHDALEEVYLRLKRTLNQLTTVNDNNKLLLKESMDMIQFELDLARIQLWIHRLPIMEEQLMRNRGLLERQDLMQNNKYNPD